MILASGATNKRPPIPGLREDARVVGPGDVLSGKVMYGQQVVAIGGALVGTEAAHFLAQEFRDVSIVELRSEISTDAVFPVKVDVNRHLDFWHVKEYVNTAVKEIKPGCVVIADDKGNEQTLPCDLPVAASVRGNLSVKAEIDSVIEQLPNQIDTLFMCHGVGLKPSKEKFISVKVNTGPAQSKEDATTKPCQTRDFSGRKEYRTDS